MAVPALKFEPENPVEERLARLEVNVENIRSDVAEIKTDIRRLDNRIDEVDKRLGGKIEALDQKLTTKIDEVDKRLNGKIDEVDKRLSGKIDAVAEKQAENFDALKNMILGLQNSFADLKVSRANDRVWWLMISACLLGIMAHGMKWF